MTEYAAAMREMGAPFGEAPIDCQPIGVCPWCGTDIYPEQTVYRLGNGRSHVVLHPECFEPFMHDVNHTERGAFTGADRLGVPQFKKEAYW